MIKRKKIKAILDYSHKTKNPCSVLFWFCYNNNLKRMTNMMGRSSFYIPEGWLPLLKHLYKMGLTAEFTPNQTITIKSR